jgi:hypothetical protein
MSRCGCPEECEQQTPHSPGTVADEEPVVFALVLAPSTNEQSVEIFKNNKLKDKQQSFCRSSHCTFMEMYEIVVKPQLSGQHSLEYKGYNWATAGEIRSIVAARNTMRDKTPHLTPVPVGAFCVIDDGDSVYRAHARVGYANPRPNFLSLHDTNKARGDLLIILQQRGKFPGTASPPFREEPRA